MKIIIASACENSYILTIHINDVERVFNSSLNLIISLVPILCFYFFTRMLYMLKLIIENTKMSDWGWSRNGSHTWSTYSNLYTFFELTVTKHF